MLTGFDPHLDAGFGRVADGSEAQDLEGCLCLVKVRFRPLQVTPGKRTDILGVGFDHALSIGEHAANIAKEDKTGVTGEESGKENVAR